MDAADFGKRPLVPQTGAHAASHSERMDDKHGRSTGRTKLADDIDDLRRKMAETFLKEASFTADPVILISRQLDVKINEYMKQWKVGRKKAR
jgi:hypothetical protein